MKKVILLAVLAAGMMLTTKAQENGFGIRGGLNISNAGGDFKNYLKDNELGDKKSRVGFNLGVIYDYGFSEHFYLQPGLYFTTKGAKAKYSYSEKEEDYSWSEETKYKINLSYLEIPILASYRIALGDNVKWHINAGPYIAFGIGGKFKIEDKYSGTEDGETSSENSKYDFPAFGTSDKDEDGDYKSPDFDYDDNGQAILDTKGVKGGLKKFDFGLSLGTGFSIKKFYVGVKYDLGLTNIADKDQYAKYKMDKDGDYQYDKNGNPIKDGSYKIKNGNFAISVGYNF